MRLLELGYELPKNWREATISDVTSKVGSGATPRGGSSVYTNNGIPLVRSQNVMDNSFSNAGLAFLSDQSASSLKNVELRANDVLLNITGDSILRCCLLPDVMIGGRVNQHVAIIRASDAVIPLYLQKWLVQDWFKDFMLSHSAGATRKAITKGQILSFPIALPPLPEQRRIAGVLGALDDKIESNRHSVSHAETLLDAIAEREAETLPEIELRSICSLTKQTWKPQSSEERSVDLYSIPAFDDGAFPEDAEVVSIKSNKTLISQAGILISRLNPRISRMWWVDPDHSRTCVCSPEFAYLTSRSEDDLASTWLAVRSAQFQSEILERVTGTSGSHQRVRPDDLITISVPDYRLLSDDIHASVLGLLKLVNTLRKQSQSLAHLRDVILPKLLSGRMRVDEAGRLVSEALDEEAC